MSKIFLLLIALSVCLLGIGALFLFIGALVVTAQDMLGYSFFSAGLLCFVLSGYMQYKASLYY